MSAPWENYCPDCDTEHVCLICHDTGIVVKVEAFDDAPAMAATSPCRDCPAGAPAQGPSSPVANGEPPG